MQLKKDTYLQGGKYRVISTLGQGGFGITYLAEQVMAKRMVCIKEFFPKEYYNRDADSLHISLGSEGNAKMMNAYKAKFIKEAQTIANLNHPNIIRIFDVFEENGTAYYTMEYIEGESLNEKVKREGALAEDVAMKYIRDVASALRYIHKRNIMHLDVKPANIMLRKEDDSAVLIDFGLSKQYDNAGEQTSATPVGISHGYAPIEQYKEGGVNTFSPVTDIYSLGATLYYLVTGRVPAEATTIGENGIGELPGHLSAKVRNAITNAMSYWRKERPQSIDIFLAMFDETTTDNNVRDVKEADDTTKIGEAETVVTGEPVTPELTPDTPKSDYDDIYIKPKKAGEKSEKAKKRKSLWWIWLLILIIGGAGFFVLYERDTPDERDTPANNEIWYTSVDGNIVEPHDSSAFDVNIVSNTYTNGKGVIKFDGDVTTIGNSAFYDCTSLTSVNIPDSVTSIGSDAFWGCKSLTSITIPEGVVSIGSSAFRECCNLTEIILPNSVKDIGTTAFYECSKLTNITIPNGVTYINPQTFSYCSSLTNVNLPDSLVSIGYFSFNVCNSLETITLPKNVKIIDVGAFACCDKLSIINLPDGITSIGEDAFNSCDMLHNINLPNSIEYIGEAAFLGCSSLKSITIPNNINEIKASTFSGCNNLQNVTISNNVHTIEEHAFAFCDNITDITIPESVTDIENGAFYYCRNLACVTISSNIEVISDDAFAGYSGFRKIYCKALTPPYIGKNVFTSYSMKFNGNMFVPKEAVIDYKTADGWNKFSNNILGYNFEN